MSGAWQVGIDIGGTFTDVVACRPGTGAVVQAKVRSRPEDPVAGLLGALEAVGLDWADAGDLVHGTTLVTNAVVEDRLAHVALLATEGFTDTLAIARQNRRHLYRLDLPPKSPPQIPEALRIGVAERLDARGGVLRELSDEAIEEAVKRALESGAEAVAIALLHAYANGAHEQRLADRLRAHVPYLALSHRVSPEAREFERTSTTALSAGVMPLTARYLERLEAERPPESCLHLFHSAGGMAAPRALRELPLGLALSGPAAGVSAASAVAEALGIESAISFDMGGTTTDVCLISAGRAEVRSDANLAGRALRMPMVAVESIGAGGGSIVRLDAGTLRVGPQSAGATPGPACYGQGGEAPTVCDANLVLGYLDATRTVGGLRLDADAAHHALAPLAESVGVGVGVPACALGVVRVANAAMARALSRVTVERGVDGRRCVLIAFGGAGPMHAVALARSFGIARVIVPRFSSAFSALGCVTARMSYTRQRTVRMASGEWAPERLRAIRGELHADLGVALAAAGCAAPGISEVAAIRYGGQSYAVEVSKPALDDAARLAEQFRECHEALYGFATHEAWELESLRVTFSGPRLVATPGKAAEELPGGASPRTTRCWFDAGRPVSAPRVARGTLREDSRLAGPAIVEDDWSTVVLPPGAALRVDALGHLHIDVEAAP